MNNIEKIETFIFDLDGTLVDTAPDLIHSLNHCLSTININPVALSDIRHMVGHGAKAMISKALELKNIPIGNHEIKELHLSFLKYYEKNIAVDTRPFPITLEILDLLLSKNKNLGICTNKPQKLAEKLLGELNLTPYFKSILGRDMVKNSKPHPDHLIETIIDASGTQENAIFIGDTEVDFKTARNANIPVIILAHGYSPISVKELGADFFFENNKDFKKFLLKN